MENLGRYFVCIQSVKEFVQGKMYRLIYGEENGVIGYNPEFINRFFRDATDKEIQKELNKMEEENKNKNALEIVQQMVNDGQISQEVAEKYFPQLKKRNEYEEIRLILRDLIYGSHSSSFPMKGYSKEQILNWLSKQTLQEWTKEDNEKVFDIIAILRGGESMTYNTPILIDWLNQIQKKNNWKPSQEQIKALEFLVRSYGESGTLSPYGETLAYSNSLLNDLKRL